MLFLQTVGRAEDSPEHALSLALHSAVLSGKGGVRAHIIIRDIIKTSHGWRADLNLVLEPKAPAMKQYSGFSEKEREKDEIDQANKELKEKEKAKKLLDELHNTEVQHTYMQRDFEVMQHEIQDYEFLSLYMEPIYEETFQAIASQFNFDSVHYVPTGALWRRAQDSFPDIDLYKAAHDQTEKATLDIQTLKAPLLDREARPGRKLKYDRELVDE